MYVSRLLASIILAYVSAQAHIEIEEGKQRQTPWYLFLQTKGAETCALECFERKMDGCRSWNWNQKTKDCFLNKQNVESSDEAGMYSGHIVADKVEEGLMASGSNTIDDNFSSIDNITQSLFSSTKSKVVKTTQFGSPYSPIVIGPTLGLTKTVRFRQDQPFTFTTWTWLWRSSPLKQARTSHQTFLLSTKLMSHQPDNGSNGPLLAPTILLNVGDGELKNQYYFSTHASRTENNKLEYHGHFSGEERVLGRWTHLALTYHPKRGMRALINGKVVVEEAAVEWPDVDRSGEMDMLIIIGGVPEGSRFAPHALISGARFVTGKALTTRSIVLEMEHTKPPSPPPQLLDHITTPLTRSFKVDIGHEFGLSKSMNMASEIDILSAAYRVRYSQSVPNAQPATKAENVTSKLRHIARNKLAREVLIPASYSYNELFGDPFPNVQKELFIRWRHKRNLSETNEGVWEEGHQVDLLLADQCPLVQSRDVPYFFLATWHREIHPDMDHPGLQSRYSPQVLLMNAMHLLVGPIASYNPNTATVPLFMKQPKLLKAVQKYYGEAMVYGNTSVLLSAGAQWDDQASLILAVGASSHFACSVACHGLSDCDVWQWQEANEHCELLRYVNKSTLRMPVVMPGEQGTGGWTAGIRPGAHQSPKRSSQVGALPQAVKRDLAAWCLRFALMINNSVKSGSESNQISLVTAKEVAAMVLGFSATIEDSHFVTTLRGNSEPAFAPLESQQHVVSQVVGQLGRERRALARETALTESILTTLESALHVLSQVMDRDTTFSSESDQTVAPLSSSSTRQEVRIPFSSQEKLKVSKSDRCEEASLYYASTAAWVSANWASPKHHPMGTSEPLFLDKPEVTSSLGAGAIGGDEVREFQEMRAENGDPDAHFWLGRQHYWGRGGVVRDRVAAARHYRAAANAGVVGAMYDLGIMLLNGEGVPRDPVAAVRYFRNAAAGGLEAAHNGLGALHMNPHLLRFGNEQTDDVERAQIIKDFGSEPNKTAAIWHFHQAGKAGNSDALYSMAQLYRDGWSLDGFDASPEHFEDALESFARAASLGHPKALGALGLALLEHESWLVVAQRQRELLELPPFAVDILLPLSPRSSGDSAMKMRIPLGRSCSAGLPLLRQLSEMGPWSSFHLSAGMQAHKLSTASTSRAEKLGHLGEASWHFGVGAELGLAMARSNDAWLHLHAIRSGDNDVWSQVTGWFTHYPNPVLVKEDEKEESERHVALRVAHAAGDGDPDAVRKLGDIYLKSSRPSLAVEYYEDAAALGNSQAMISLARLAHNGLSVLGVFDPTSNGNSPVFEENRTLALSSLRDLYSRCQAQGGDGYFPATLALWQLQLQETMHDLQANLFEMMGWLL